MYRKVSSFVSICAILYFLKAIKFFEQRLFLWARALFKKIQFTAEFETLYFHCLACELSDYSAQFSRRNVDGGQLKRDRICGDRWSILLFLEYLRLLTFTESRDKTVVGREKGCWHRGNGALSISDEQNPRTCYLVRNWKESEKNL